METLINFKMLKTVIVFLLIAFFNHSFAHSIKKLGRANADEWFSERIEPKMFNWTLDSPTQFEYRVSLKDHPDLPSWMRYMYSHESEVGFIYGTPPEKMSGKQIYLDALALNRKTYETRHIVLLLSIIKSANYHKNTIQMKIDNLNWIHLMDPGRVENLKSIFRQDLWPESKNDLHISLMDSAVEMGGRVPLKPQQHEG